ncbi:MAG: hypothetical protein ABGW90_01180, partial [Martelella sp.]
METLISVGIDVKTGSFRHHFTELCLTPDLTLANPKNIFPARRFCVNRHFSEIADKKPAPMIDPFGRAITYLRVSVTDRCDFRCTYCMAENMTFLPKRDL